MPIERRKSRVVHKGSVPIGGDAPIAVQSMTTTHTDDLGATVAQIHALEALGCEIIRVAVPHRRAAEAIAEIKPRIHIPLIADIHFSHRLALAAIEAGADGIRINPGNLKKKEHVEAVVAKAAEHHIPIRIGVNSGSVRPREQLQVAPDERELVPLMVEQALSYAQWFEGLGFRDIVLSVKASDPLATVEAYRAVAAACDYPLHIGVTAAGPPEVGIIKSAIGLGILLSDGIGDTIRVSLTGPPHPEVTAAYEILAALGLRGRRSPEIISCPTCGRCEIDLVRLVGQVTEALRDAPPWLRVAVMGCVVNGPGEASDADIGVAGGKGFGYIFRRGELIRKVPAEELAAELLAEIRRLDQSP